MTGCARKRILVVTALLLTWGILAGPLLAQEDGSGVFPLGYRLLNDGLDLGLRLVSGSLLDDLEGELVRVAGALA